MYPNRVWIASPLCVTMNPKSGSILVMLWPLTFRAVCVFYSYVLRPDTPRVRDSDSPRSKNYENESISFSQRMSGLCSHRTIVKFILCWVWTPMSRSAIVLRWQAYKTHRWYVIEETKNIPYIIINILTSSAQCNPHCSIDILPVHCRVISGKLLSWLVPYTENILCPKHYIIE